jgi:hypothetical protein
LADIARAPDWLVSQLLLIGTHIQQDGGALLERAARAGIQRYNLTQKHLFPK